MNAWTVRRWASEYARAYRDLLAVAERWIPPLGWYMQLGRDCRALRGGAR